MNRIECYRVSHRNIWLISVGDKLLGEARDLEKGKAEQRDIDLKFLFFIYTVINDETNKENLIKELKLEADDPELQIKLQEHVRELVISGQFGSPYFTKYWTQIKDLTTAGLSIERQVDTVKTGLKHRWIDEKNIKLHDEQPLDQFGKPYGYPVRGYVLESAIESGKVNIGLSAKEVETIMNKYWFSEPLLNSINDFLQREYLGLSHDLTPETKPVDENDSEGKPTSETASAK